MALVGIALAMPVAAQEYRYSQDMLSDGTFVKAENVKPARAPKTIAETVKAVPALPTVEQICSAHAKYIADSTTYRPFIKAVEQTMLYLMEENERIRQQIEQARLKQAEQGQHAMQQYQSNVNAGLMPSQEEMMQLYMSGEITDKMSDEQMMDVMAGKFAQKWGISKQEYLKIIGMAQSNPKQTEAYLKANHPDLYKRLYAANAGYNTQDTPDDPNEPRLNEISDNLSDLQDRLMNAVSSYGAGFDNLSDQFRNEWDASEEARQIDAIEAALDKRVGQWISTLAVGQNGHNDVPFPAWWTEERKKENALIDQWNRRNAQRWLAVAQEGESSIRTVFEQAAVLETENEQLGKQGSADNMIYMQNKLRLFMIFNHLQYLVQPCQDALGFPCIEHVETSGSIHLGKG